VSEADEAKYYEEVLTAIKTVRAFLDDYWIDDGCRKHQSFGCASCRALVLNAELSLLADGLIEDQAMDEQEATRSEGKWQDMGTDPELLALIERSRRMPQMAPEQIEQQRRSWVIGELMLQHEDMSREEAEALYDNHTT
jgi:hypothetical protein